MRAKLALRRGTVLEGCMLYELPANMLDPTADECISAEEPSVSTTLYQKSVLFKQGYL